MPTLYYALLRILLWQNLVGNEPTRRSRNYTIFMLLNTLIISVLVYFSYLGLANLLFLMFLCLWGSNLLGKMYHRQYDQKKSPNVYKSCLKMISLEK